MSATSNIQGIPGMALSHVHQALQTLCLETWKSPKLGISKEKEKKLKNLTFILTFHIRYANKVALRNLKSVFL